MNFQKFLKEEDERQQQQSFGSKVLSTVGKGVSAVKQGISNIGQQVKSAADPRPWIERLKDAVSKYGKTMQRYRGVEVFMYSNPGSRIYHSDTGLKVAYDKPQEETSFGEATVPLEHPSPEIHNVDNAKLQKHIERSFRNKNPLLIWGASGIGKTEAVHQVAKKLGVDVVIYDLANKEPSDFLGVPSVVRDKSGMGRTVFNLPLILPTDDNPPPKRPDEESKGEGKGGFLFFDEMNRAPAPVLAASLGLLNDRKMQGYELPAKWVIIAAANRSADDPSVTPLSGPIRARVPAVNFVPSVKDWGKWAQSSAAQDESGNPIIDPILIGFLNFKQELFHKYNPEEETGEAQFPTPRGWTRASNEARKEAIHLGRELSDDELEDIYAARIGTSSAKEFIEYRNLVKEVKLEDLFKVFNDFNKAPLPPKSGGAYQVDKLYAMLNAIVLESKGKMDAKKFENIVRYSIRLDEMEAATYLLRDIMRTDSEWWKNNSDDMQRILQVWHQHYGSALETPEHKKSKNKEKNEWATFDEWIA